MKNAQPVIGQAFERVFYGCGMVQHVWVDLSGKWSQPAPGVLLEWRRGHLGKWEGLVLRADTYSTGSGLSWHVAQSWLSADHIRPARAERPDVDLSGYRPVNE